MNLFDQIIVIASCVFTAALAGLPHVPISQVS